MMIMLKKGSKGNEVKILQYILNINADGVFGKNTEAAVKSFQLKYKISADGIVGPNTWTKIAETRPMIRVGSTGNNVKAWQTIVGTNVDGGFGNQTRAATVAYQVAANLEADGIVGQMTWKKALLDSSNVIDNTQRPVDYKQYDSKWASVVYTRNNTYDKSQTIKSSGCGPTSMADIVATWWDSSVTPITLAALSVANGFRTFNSGTAWDFFKFCANKYGASKFIQTSSYATAANALKDGAYVVASMGPGLYTKGGHYICWWKTDGTYNYVNDPASAASNRAKSPCNIIKTQAKQFFIFYK